MIGHSFFTFTIKTTIQWNSFISDSVLDFAGDKKRFQKSVISQHNFYVIRLEKGKKLPPRLKDKVHGLC